jgi:hypothetical protein
MKYVAEMSSIGIHVEFHTRWFKAFEGKHGDCLFADISEELA